jgi:PAS domain S-box-containing protein
MNKGLTITPQRNYTNKFFSKSLNPMAISKTKDGTYIEVNEAFTKITGLRRQELIGQTSVGIGHITAQQRLVIINAIKKNGYAQNIELEVRVKNNEARCELFNSSEIKMGKGDFLLTVITDITKRKLAEEARQNNILFESLTAIAGTGMGVILIRDHHRHRQQPYPFFINAEARRALNGRTVKDILDAVDGYEPAYFNTETSCYRVKTNLTHHNPPVKIILLEPQPDYACIQARLKNYNLSCRQEETALLAAMGHSTREIAEKFFITEYTVKDHLKEIFQKIGVRSRSELCPKILGWL